jgi:hypothetical protein
MHEVSEGHGESIRNQDQIVDVQSTVPVLPAADAFGVPVDEFAEFDLGEAGVFAGGSEVGPDDPAPGEDPGGWWVEVHSTTLERSWLKVFTHVGKS